MGWHIVNLVLMYSALIVEAIFVAKEESSDLEYDKEKFEYYDDIAEFINDIIGVYVDLFLLWLLYRFMRP